MIVLGDDETWNMLIDATSLSPKKLKLCLNYPIGQLSSFLFPPYPNQVLSLLQQQLVEPEPHEV